MTSEERDGERFRHFLSLPIATRARWVELYTTARALRTALDNAIRLGVQPKAPSQKRKVKA